ncbi:hypothetical protein EGW08_008530, partial [Elysia chlorotica]
LRSLQLKQDVGLRQLLWNLGSAKLRYEKSDDSLLCYQCATTSPDSHECKDDFGGLVNTSLGLTNKYFKNCTAANQNWTRCMILEAEGALGVQTFFHRGCHDGVHFSKLHQHQNFQNLPTNNESTCARITDSRESVCFRFCDTDFCNGPQATPDPCNRNSTSNSAIGCGSVALRGTMPFSGVAVSVLVHCVVVSRLGQFFQ